MNDTNPPAGPTMQERIARMSANGLIACLPPQYIAASAARFSVDPWESLAGKPETSVDAKVTPGQERATAKKDGAVAVIPVHGVIVPREDRYSQYFGETGAENTAERVRAAVADQRVKAIVLHVDSPGGNVNGVTEAAAVIRAARGKKPIVAHADFNMASAAYWLASAADEIIASPSAQVGAVGVIAMVQDVQGAMELAGVKMRAYAKPDDKADGWGYWDNTDKFDARMNQEIADAYAQFINDIAASRDIDRAAVLEEWAGYYAAKRAKLLGMVDKVRSISETFAAYTVVNTGSMQAARNKLAILKRKQR